MAPLTNEIAEIFRKLIVKLDTNQLLTTANQNLLTLLKGSPTEEEYKQNLIESIVVHVESTKALHGIIHQLLTTSKYPHLKGVTKVMEQANQTIRSDVKKLVPQYKESVIVDETTIDKTSQLELNFITSQLELDLTYSFIDAFGTISNQELFKVLFTFTPEEVGFCLLKYVRTYVSVLYDSSIKQLIKP
ncbi:hypothetical protein [Bacillus sp. 2205SS5-2]|uniref:hypothetical protein n=1 Tax=Bacillus sp. 2205SS5-2 TaxID=3109031 RepID=UPI003004E849